MTYADALIHEAELRRAEIDEPFRTLYLGGGTPSLLQLATLERIMDGLTRIFGNPVWQECTLEANPEDITGESLRQYRELGINRISIGVQSFDPKMLAAIGRNHTSRQSLEALETLASAGINFNADLIYGLPGQTPSQAMDDLARMLTFRPPHLSAYLLSYEPGTRLYAKMLKGEVAETSETTAVEIYSKYCATMSASGYMHYEISNYARPGMEARHNSSYWNYTPYLGLGASAHSFDGLTRRSNPCNIKKYIAGIEQCYRMSASLLPAEAEAETAKNRLNDYIITSLRTSYGLDIEFAKQIFDPALTSELLDNIQKAGSLLSTKENRVRIPESDWLTADAILRELIIE